MKRKFILSSIFISSSIMCIFAACSSFNIPSSDMSSSVNIVNANTIHNKQHYLESSFDIDWENNIVNGVQLKDDENFNNDEQINLRRHFNVYTNSIDDIFDAGETSYIMLKAKGSFFKKIKIHNIVIGNDWKWYMNPDNQELILLERQNPQPNLNESNQLEIEYNYIDPPHGAAGWYYYFNYKTNNNFVPPPVEPPPPIEPVPPNNSDGLKLSNKTNIILFATLLPIGFITIVVVGFLIWKNIKKCKNFY